MSFRRTFNLTYYGVKQLVDFYSQGGRCDFRITPGWRDTPSAQAVSVLLIAQGPHAKFDSGVADRRFFVTRSPAGNVRSRKGFYCVIPSDSTLYITSAVLSFQFV
jgi:hypothetical protein